ncbi:MAG: M15 family metallopeptidase [Bacteroidia bacterium]
MKSLFYIVLTAFSLCSCEPRHREASRKTIPEQTKDSARIGSPLAIRDSSVYEKQFVRSGLVNIRDFDTNIRVVLLYNTDKNFIGKTFYGGLDQCYLPCEVALKLNNAQKYLKAGFPLYNLIVFDAARPLHVQQMMWDSLKMNPVEKYNYIARPDQYSLHNYGAAIDLGIIGENGVLLDMGTPFDYFGELAQPKLEAELYQSGRLSKSAYSNRLLLRNVMMRAGFNPITSEWWHFNACTKAYAAEHYVLVE